MARSSIEIGLAMNDYILSHGLKKGYIARCTNINPTRFSLLMNGKAIMTAEEYQRILQALGMPVRAFGDENVKVPETPESAW